MFFGESGLARCLLFRSRRGGRCAPFGWLVGREVRESELGRGSETTITKCNYDQACGTGDDVPYWPSEGLRSQTNNVESSSVVAPQHIVRQLFGTPSKSLGGRSIPKGSTLRVRQRSVLAPSLQKKIRLTACFASI